VSGETRKKQGGSKPKWMYARDGVQHGPFTSKDLEALANRGELLPTDLIWKEGMKDWVRADKSSVVFPEPTENPVANDFDLPPLNVATFRERISGGANQGRARDATRKEVYCGADHREAPRG
jgi:hypothetical protein